MNEPENKDVGGEYRKFDPEEPNYEQEFTKDAGGGKSNLILFNAY